MSDEEILSGEEKVLDMSALDLVAESKGSYAKYKILCQLRGCKMFLDESRFQYMFEVLEITAPHTFRGGR